LEEVVIRVLLEYGVKGERSAGETGVWLDVDDPSKVRKICALGVRTSRWVSMHGLALNVNTNLDYFQMIVPCGIQNKSVTSLSKEIHQEVDLTEVFDKFVKHFLEVFETSLIKN